MAFLRDTDPSHQPAIQAPGVVIGLILFMVAAHLARVYAGDIAVTLNHWGLIAPVTGPSSLPDRLIYEFGFVPARYSPSFLAAHHLDPGTWLEQAAPFVTYMFVHGGVTHITVNCFWLLAFGAVVARRFGTWRFLVFFVICGLAAIGLYLACNWQSMEPVIGASGAISGCMAAGIRMIQLNRPGWQTPQLAPITSRSVLIFTVLWFGANLLAGLTGLGTGLAVGLVAWQAHIGGYVAGLLLAGPFDRLGAAGKAQAA